jgi:hypothetical protein
MRRSMSARRPASSVYRERSTKASRPRVDLSTRTVGACIDQMRALGWVNSTTGVIGVFRLFVLSQRDSTAVGSLTSSLGDLPYLSWMGKSALRDLPYLSICSAIHSSLRMKTRTLRYFCSIANRPRGPRRRASISPRELQ